MVLMQHCWINTAGLALLFIHQELLACIVYNVFCARQLPLGVGGDVLQNIYRNKKAKNTLSPTEYKIFLQAGEGGVTPQKLIFLFLIHFFLKPGTTDCEQHRAISLMSHLTKVLLRVLMCRMRNKIRPEISEKQLFCKVEALETQFSH